MDGHVSFYKRIEWILLTLSEFVGLQSKSANVIITAPLYVLILLVWLLSFNLEGSKLLWGKILFWHFGILAFETRNVTILEKVSKIPMNRILNPIYSLIRKQKLVSDLVRCIN